MKISSTSAAKKLWFKIGKWNVFIGAYKTPAYATAGITNETEDGFYVPFIDYDKTNYSKVVRECKRITKQWGLSGLAIICSHESLAEDGSSHGGYHIIGLDKLTFRQHMSMLSGSSCDLNYRNVPKIFRFRHWVLRIYPKIDIRDWKMVKDRPFIKAWVIGSQDSPYQQSRAHYMFLKMWYGLPVVPNLKLDDYSNITVAKYNAISG